MRTLNRNKQTLWYVTSIGTEPKLDIDGFETGEIIKLYSAPVKIKINIFPSNGLIAEQIFGKDQSFDMMAVSNDIILNKDSLLFLTEPLSNYDTTYDFVVDTINKSLNTYNYGLRSKT